MLPLIFFFADQGLKMFVRTRLALGESLWSFGPFSFLHFENTAGPFSLPVPEWFLIVMSLCVLGVVLAWYFRSYHRPVAALWILSGGVSNIIDRIVYHQTTDYLGLPFHGYWNLADVSVLVGLLLLCFSGKKEPEPLRPQTGA